MKTRWERPIVYSAGIRQTATVRDDYPGRVQCVLCGKTYETGAQFNGHLIEEHGISGELAGYECPKAEHNNNYVDESAKLLS